jgi:hypothetical protein
VLQPATEGIATEGVATCDTTAVHRQFPGLQRERLDDIATRMPAGSESADR